MADVTHQIDKADWISKKTKNTKAWWQAKANWSSDEYEQRRNAVIARIREKWPEEKMLNGRDRGGSQQKYEVREWLRPLVVTYNDTNWPYGATTESRLDRQLQYYVSWALYLNRTFHYTPTPTTAPSYPIVSSDQIISKSPRSRLSTAGQTSIYWSDTSSDNDTDRLETISDSRTSSNLPNTAHVSVKREHDLQPFNWDDIELRLDATELDIGEIWLPMIDLKPGNKHVSCHWADFNLASLYTLISKETGTDINPITHKFVCLNSEEPFEFYREGAYRIMLKRFANAIQPSNVLHLQIVQHPGQSRSAVVGRPDSYLTPPQSALRNSNHAATIRKREAYQTNPLSSSSGKGYGPDLDTLQDRKEASSSSKQSNRRLHEVDGSGRPIKRQRVPSADSKELHRSAATNVPESQFSSRNNIGKELSRPQKAGVTLDSPFERRDSHGNSHDSFFMPRVAETIVFSEANSPSTELLSATPEPKITKLERLD